MCHKEHDRATKWTHDRAQEVGSIPDEEQERSDASLQGHVGSWLGQRLARKKEHDSR